MEIYFRIYYYASYFVAGIQKYNVKSINKIFVQPHGNKRVEISMEIKAYRNKSNKIKTCK